MATNTLEVDSVMYRIGDRSLLHDIYLQCNTGEIVGLLGRNGSGKSTLLKIIFGSINTSNKHIRINGQVCHTPYKAELISYLSQDSFLPKFVSLQKIIQIFIPAKENRQRIKQDTRIVEHLEKTPGQLSHGELRYFETFLLLNLNTDFILLDEPFSAIEPLYKDKLKELILEYSSGKGIIVTDQDYKQILAISGRIILLSDGCTKPVKNLTDLEDWNYLPSGAIQV